MWLSKMNSRTDVAHCSISVILGHALEAATEYDSKRLVHGEGVAIGMVLAHQFSSRVNLASPDDAKRVEAHLKAVGLPVSMNEIPGTLPPVEMLMAAIATGQEGQKRQAYLHPDPWHWPVLRCG